MLLLVASLLLLSLPLGQAEEAQNEPLYASLDGPLMVAAGSVTQYTLTMIGGPGGEGAGNYSYMATLTGDGETAGRAISPVTGGPKATGEFFLNLTAPSVPQTVTIAVDCTSSASGKASTAKVMMNVVVVEPIVLTASLRNTGNVSATDIPISLQVLKDGEWMEFHSTTVDLAAGASYAFKYNWTATDLDAGEHRVRMVLDPSSHIVTFEGGDSIYETTIYYKVSGYGWMNTLLWVLVAVLGVTVFLIWRRPNRGKRKR